MREQAKAIGSIKQVCITSNVQVSKSNKHRCNNWRQATMNKIYRVRGMSIDVTNPRKRVRMEHGRCDKARNHIDQVKQASSAKMQHTRRSHGKQVMGANSVHE